MDSLNKTIKQLEDKDKLLNMLNYIRKVDFAEIKHLMDAYETTENDENNEALIKIKSHKR